MNRQELLTRVTPTDPLQKTAFKSDPSAVASMFYSETNGGGRHTENGGRGEDLVEMFSWKRRSALAFSPLSR